MGLSAKLLFGGLVAGTALAYYVQKRHVGRGESYVTILTQLPAAARRSADDLKRRAALALDEGRAAARARDDELVRQIDAVRSGSVEFAGPPGT